MVLTAVAFSTCDSWDEEKWVVSGDVKDIHKDFERFGAPAQTIIKQMENVSCIVPVP